jgi:sarcosine oxidase subunit gamma
MTPAAKKESPMHAEIAHLQPQWAQVNGMAVAANIGERARQARLLETLALCDVTALPRLGLKGPGAEALLQANGITPPPAIYDHRPLDGDGLLIRLGAAEFFLEEGISGNVVGKLANIQAANIQGQAGRFCHCLSRQDAGMILAGPEAFEVLAQTCGYNFRSPECDVVASRVAGVSCLLYQEKREGRPLFRIWCDGSYGAYLWETLLGIVRELGGDCVGLACLFALPVTA